MSQITLSEEQTRLLESASDPVEVRGADGQLLMVFRPLTQQERDAVAESRKRLARRDGWIPAERVQAFLARATEIDQTEGMTPEKMAELLRRVKAGEPV